MDIIKAIQIFPRLMDKFELKRPSEVRNFHEVIELDKDCTKLYSNIKEGKFKLSYDRKDL